MTTEEYLSQFETLLKELVQKNPLSNPDRVGKLTK
jgi:hypothetical protein